MSSLEEVWAYREKTAYPTLFGVPSRGIFPLDAGIFADVFGVHDVDPRWLHLGVMEFSPTPTRQSWLYVTSGASNPWETEPQDYRPDEHSWLGMEFVIEVADKADWPIYVLHRLLAYQLLVTHGHFGDYEPVSYGFRVPAGGSIDRSGDSPLTFLAVAKPSHYESTVQLDSGIFDFLHVVGITEQERDYAKSTSTEELIARLTIHGAYPVTDPKRVSIF